MRRITIVCLLAIVGAIVTGSAALGSGEVATLDDGGLYLFVSNNGTFAYDSSASRDEYSGLYYPRDTYRWVMSGGGIWIAGKVSNRWRVTISGAESEFAPGPMNSTSGAPSPFPIYKITRGEDYALSDDYHNWPVTFGAPTNVLGQPLTMGSQCIFTLFNDADTARHQFDIAGTLPLGVEVRLYAYTYDNVYQTHDTMMTQVVFLDYTVINRSGEDIDSLIVTLYGDPDIGYSATDRVGSDVESGMAFCYDESDRDQYYGSMTPAVGLLLLNELAGSTNFYYSYRRTDPASEKLDSPDKTINLVKGLRLTGAPYVDSTSQLESKFPFSGNVSDSTGWLNLVSKDYRMVVNAAPRRLAAGDSMNIVGALIVARDSTRNGSVRQLVSTATMVRELYQSNVGAVRMSISPPAVVSVRGRELYGIDWGGRFLSGGLDLASRYFGDTTSHERLSSVRVAFTATAAQRAYRYVHVGGAIQYASFESSSIAVTDAGSGEPLDYGFIDNDDDGSIARSEGGFDPIVVFTTVYDGTAKSHLINMNLLAPSARKLLVVQVGAASDDPIGGEIFADPAAMSQSFAPMEISDAGILTLNEPAGKGYSERTLRFVNDTRFAQEVELISSRPEWIRVVPADVELGAGESSVVFVHQYSPPGGEFSAKLGVVSHRLRTEVAEIETGINLVKGTKGDVDRNDTLTLSDLVAMIRLLYRDAPMLVPVRLLDLSCDGYLDVADVVILINLLYHQAPLPCGILN